MLNSLALLSSPTEWMVVLVIVVILFGGSKIPQLMKGVGQGLGEFKKGMDESKSIFSSSDEKEALKKEEEAKKDETPK